MKSLKVDADLQSMYANYYETGASEWRRTRSIDVTDNIRTLCKDIPINTVIEIGAGEGAVLQRLSDLNFAKGLWALEISPRAWQPEGVHPL